jgi:hypothetical protein
VRTFVEKQSLLNGNIRIVRDSAIIMAHQDMYGDDNNTFQYLQKQQQEVAEDHMDDASSSDDLTF